MALSQRFKRGRYAQLKIDFSLRKIFRSKQKEIDAISPSLLETNHYEYIHSNVNMFMKSYTNLVDQLAPAENLIKELVTKVKGSNDAIIKVVEDMTKNVEDNLGLTPELLKRGLQEDSIFKELIQIRDDITKLNKNKFKDVSQEERASTVQEYANESRRLVNLISGMINNRKFYKTRLDVPKDFEKLLKDVNAGKIDEKTNGRLESILKSLYQAEGVFLELGVENALGKLFSKIWPEKKDINTQASGSGNVLYDVSTKFTNIDPKIISNIGFNIKLAEDKYSNYGRSVDTKNFWQDNIDVIRGLEIAEYMYWNWRALSAWHTRVDESVDVKVSDTVDSIIRQLENLYRLALLFTVMVMHEGKDKVTMNSFDDINSFAEKFKKYVEDGGPATLYVILGNNIITTAELFKRMNIVYSTNMAAEQIRYPEGSVSVDNVLNYTEEKECQCIKKKMTKEYNSMLHMMTLLIIVK